MKLLLSSVLLLLFASPCLGLVTITTKSLPNGTVDTPFSSAVNADDGCTPYKWALVSGSLPSGITDVVSTNTESLDLKGTPTKAGTYTFTIAVTGCGGHVSEVSYKIVVQAAANHIVDLNWKASTSSNISGYNVYRSPDESAWTKINPSLIASTIYSDDTVADGNTYYYAATAVTVEGIESSKSAIVKATIP